MPSRHPVFTRVAPVVAAAALAFSGLAALAAPATADPVSDVRINEVRSDPTDTVEFVNNGSVTADVSGYVFKDDDDTHSFPLPAGSTIPPGGHVAVDITAFGLGKGDSARLFTPDGVTLVDATTWPAGTHATTWGRCADGTGSFVAMTPTLGAANACATPDSAVRINEFSSNNPDFIELLNTGTGPVDLSGWMLKDNSENNSYTFPGGSSIAAGEHKVLNGEGVDFLFGLGNGDSVRLYSDSDLSTPLDSTTYPSHPAAGKSYGRCPDATGAFEVTAAATKGAVNQCAVPAGGENIKINEVQSDPADLVELTNIGETPVDISGYVLKDNDDTHAFTIPASTTLAPHAYVTFDVNAAFGLGKGDSVRLYQPNLANLLDSTTYPADTHATNWGRCPNGTGDFQVVTNTLGAANSCDGEEPSGPPDVVINEVESNGDQVADWVELKNRSDVPVNVSGWKILDNDPAHVATPVVVPSGTTIPAGGYYAIYTEIAQTPGFGLGGADSATLLLPDGTTEVDSTSWTTHAATTWGRCPDGTGDFRVTTASTRGLANACSPVRINEVESTGGTPGDWVELVNISASPVDVSGYVVKDGDDAHSYAIPASTSIAAKGYLVLDESALGFGFDDADAVRLFAADGTTLVEQYGWTTPAAQSYARCKDGVGDFKDAKATTKGAVNSCPGLETAPWPGDQSVTTADLAETFVQDLSGLAFDPADPDILWAAQNKKGTLFKLTRNGDDAFVPVAGWPKDPLYPDGTGAPDTEGITIGPDGFVYLAAERNNAASGVSRMSILRYDPAATGTTVAATNEWNLTSKIPAAGANLGLEGVAFVPDSYLTANGFVDQSTSAAYSPAAYPNHGSGLYVVAVEDTGDLIAFALDSDGTTSHKIATIDSGFEHLADVSFDPERQRLWAVTDDTHDGRTSQLKIDGSGAFVVDTAYDRPVGMPNLNNEGLAIAPQSRCVDGKKEVLWSDDGDTDGHSLRRGTISCTVLALIGATPTITGTPAVGETLTAAPGTWGPAPVGLTYAWYAGDAPIASATGSSLQLTADLVGSPIKVAVTGTKTDYPTVTKTSEATAAVAAGTLTTAVPTIGGNPVVGGTATVAAGTWGPAPVTLAYQWYAAGVPLQGRTGTTLDLGPELAGKALTVTVSGTKAGYAGASRTSAAATVAAGTLTGPVPTVSGTAKVGIALTADAGAWGPAPVSLAYQWLADGTVIAGATGTTFTPTASYAGATITVRVTGSKAGYTSLDRTSAGTTVAVGSLTAVKPKIAGNARVGKALKVVTGSWKPAPVTVKVQWFANGTAIKGATGNRLVLTKALKGKRITVKVTGSKAGYASQTLTSAATGKVAARR